MGRWALVVMVAVVVAACSKETTAERSVEVPVVRPEAPPENPAGATIPDALIGTEAQCTCGSKVEVGKEAFFSIYEDRYHFFCCGHCKSSFDKDPAGHLKVRNNGVKGPEVQ